MMQPDYSYQQRLCAQAIRSMEEHKKTVLAVSCAGGKTRMSLQILKQVKRKALVLTHGQVVLRKQYCDSAKQLGLKVHELRAVSSRRYPTGSIVVCLPHALAMVPQDRLKAFLKQFEVLVIDEAHHFYYAEMVRRVRDLVDIPELLLTASPSVFIRHNKRVGFEYNILFFSTEELLNHGVIKSPQVALEIGDFDFTERDYTKTWQAKTHASSRQKAQKTLDGARQTLVTQLGLKTKSWKALAKDREKILIVANSIEQAKDLCFVLREQTLKCEVSCSENDPNSAFIDAFQRARSFEILIVVGRARLGFNFPQLTTLIDLSGSMNPDVLFQMINRVTRRYSKKKIFLKIMPQSLRDDAVRNLNFTLALISPELFREYEGGYNKTVVDRIDVSSLPEAEGYLGPSKKVKTAGQAANKQSFLVPNFSILREMKLGQVYVGSIAEALEVKKRNGSRYPSASEAILACKKLGINSMHEYSKKRKADPLLPGNPRKVYSEWSYKDLRS